MEHLTIDQVAAALASSKYVSVELCENGIRTKPQHYPICISKNIRIFAPFTSDYPNLPEID